MTDLKKTTTVDRVYFELLKMQKQLNLLIGMLDAERAERFGPERNVEMKPIGPEIRKSLKEREMAQKSKKKKNIKKRKT